MMIQRKSPCFQWEPIHFLIKNPQRLFCITLFSWTCLQFWHLQKALNMGCLIKLMSILGARKSQFTIDQFLEKETSRLMRILYEEVELLCEHNSFLKMSLFITLPLSLGFSLEIQPTQTAYFMGLVVISRSRCFNCLWLIKYHFLPERVAFVYKRHRTVAWL